MNRFIVTLFPILAITAHAATAYISVIVQDADTFEPISGATVKAWFEEKIGWRAWSESAPIITDTSVTDSRGFCRLKGKTNVGHVSCEVVIPPKGHYRGYGGSFDFKCKNLFDVWQPDNLVMTIRLDRVENAIPMFVKRAFFPNAGGKVKEILDIEQGVFSYDFLKGDWMPPWGDGEVADVIFHRLPREDCGMGVNGRGQNRPSFRDVVTIDFPGTGNGIAHVPVKSTSELKIRASVDSGFISHYEQVCGRGKDLQAFRTCDKTKCFCFRIRTKYDERGNVIKGYYGKIYGDFEVGWSYHGVSSVKFLYYLNPKSNDRNLEWDMKNNHCPKPGDIGIPMP